MKSILNTMAPGYVTIAWMNQRHNPSYNPLICMKLAPDDLKVYLTDSLFAYFEHLIQLGITSREQFILALHKIVLPSFPLSQKETHQLFCLLATRASAWRQPVLCHNLSALVSMLNQMEDTQWLALVDPKGTTLSELSSSLKRG